MIYRFRIILDTYEDVFRDIEIQDNATMEDLHNAITQAFGFGGQEMASFYISDENWEQGEEIALFDMSDEGNLRTMADTLLEDVVNQEQPKLIYIYDFLNMWTFLVELADVGEPEVGVIYPNLMFALGQIPEEAPETEFIGDEAEMDDDEFLEEYDLDPEDYDNLDFDENWN